MSSVGLLLEAPKPPSVLTVRAASRPQAGHRLSSHFKSMSKLRETRFTFMTLHVLAQGHLHARLVRHGFWFEH